MINGKKVIALSGVESTGKTTLATMLVGRLRSRGILAEIVYEPGASLPFPPTFLDQGLDGWMYQVTRRISNEIAAATRANVAWLIVDRTPIDFVAYYKARFVPQHHEVMLARAMSALAASWVRQYDGVYFLRSQGVEYREDGYRAAPGINTWRETSEAPMLKALQDARPIQHPVEVSGSFRERSEFVYHDILREHLNETRPARAYEQVSGWLRQRGWKLREVRAQGSNSLTRFHAPTDNDDIDMMVVVEGDANYAVEVRADFMQHKEQMENMVQADLDVLIVPAGLEAHEV